MSELACFNACDVRGEFGVNIYEVFAHRIGRAVEWYFGAKSIAIGLDACETSPAFLVVASHGMQDTVAQKVGITLKFKTCPALMKQTMRSQEAVYGGEFSAHPYSRDLAYCDGGINPCALIAEFVSHSGSSLVNWVQERFRLIPR